MSKYTIQINYTSNKNKAGKLALLNETGNTILKADVVLPSWLHNSDSFNSFSFNLEKFIPDNYTSTNVYADRKKITEFQDLLGNSYLQSHNDTHPLILKNNEFHNGKISKGFDEAITVSPETFSVLKKILSDSKNTIDFSANKAWFLFGQKECQRNYDTDFYSYKKIGNNIEKEEQLIANKIKEEKAEFLAKQNAKTLKTETIKPSIEKRFEQIKPEPKRQEPVKAIQPKSFPTITPRQSFSSNNSHLNRSNNTNDLDAFDLMYMTAFPDMAPFYRPTSGLAWMIYFNNQANHEYLQRDPVNCINQINGFENVRGCSIRTKETYGDSVYNLEMYSDEAKTNYLGTAKFSTDKGLVVTDNKGNQMIVSEMEGKPGYTVLTESDNSSKSFIEVVQDKNNNFVGNWTVEPNNSVMVSSSLTVDKELSISSDPSKSINLDNIQTSPELSLDNFKLDNNNTLDFGGKEANNTIDFSGKDNNFTLDSKPEDKYNSRYEPPPPPPPPPPPEDKFSFTSSDPYSKSGYSM